MPVVDLTHRPASLGGHVFQRSSVKGGENTLRNCFSGFPRVFVSVPERLLGRGGRLRHPPGRGEVVPDVVGGEPAAGADHRGDAAAGATAVALHKQQFVGVSLGNICFFIPPAL